MNTAVIVPTVSNKQAQKLKKQTNYLATSLKRLKKRAEPGSRVGSGSAVKLYGSENPDPDLYENVTDPGHHP
jgi:hypothetical protein